jgi:hypothetical protein
MKIKIVWQIDPANTEEQRATIIAGQIGREVNLALLAGLVQRAYGPVWQALIIDAPGLGHELSVEELPGTTRSFVSKVDGKLRKIMAMLNTHDIRAEIMVDEGDLLKYATDQEELARRRESAILEAIAGLKATRSWFKDKRLAEIRRGLENVLR